MIPYPPPSINKSSERPIIYQADIELMCEVEKLKKKVKKLKKKLKKLKSK